MTTLFVLRNQHSLFLNRQGEWVAGSEANSLFRCKNKDEALNEMFEISARDFGQRVQVESVPASAKGQPVIPEEWIVEVPVTGDQAADDAGAPADDNTLSQSAAIDQPAASADDRGQTAAPDEVEAIEPEQPPTPAADLFSA